MWTLLWLVLLCARDTQALSHFILKFILWRVMLDTAIGSGMDMWPKPNQWQSSQGILLELPGNRFLGGTSGKEPACQCMRHKGCHFDPWVEKIPWRKAWQPTPVFLPGESPWAEKSGGLQSMGSQRVGYDWSDWAHMHQEIGCSLFSRIAKFHLCYYMETIHLITRPTWKKTVFLTA